MDPCKEVTPVETECHVHAIPFWIQSAASVDFVACPMFEIKSF